MPLTNNDIKSELSYAYLHAVVSHAGCVCEKTDRLVDNLGIDARLTVDESFGPGTIRTHFTVDVQLRATSKPVNFKKGRWGYDLEVKLYNRLRSTTTAAPLLLVLLILPKGADAWLSCTARALSLKKCAYWVSLYGAPDTHNEATVRVSVSRKNRFSVASLRTLLGTFACDQRVTYEA